MKQVLKALIPQAWRPAARKLYYRMSDRTPNIYHAYPDMEKLSALKCSVSYNRYGGYCVPESASHRPAAKAVLSGKVYEPETIAYMACNCMDRDIVHAGTFFGDFLPALSQAIHSGALVWAFEPNEENWRCAKITIELNAANNVKLTHAGLGSNSDSLLLQTEDDNGLPLGGGSKIVEDDTSSARKSQIDVVSIDEVIPTEREIGILQLDVEGYEQQALSGSLSTIKRCLPVLILEVNPDSTLIESPWFKDNILSLGYEYLSSIHGNLVYSCQMQ